MKIIINMLYFFAVCIPAALLVATLFYCADFLRHSKRFFSLIIGLLFFTTVAHSTNYYIATTGSDGNAGSISSPFRNWQKINDIGLQAGDTVFIRGGTYRSTYNAAVWQHLYFSNLNGTASQPVVIMAYPGEYPIFNLDNITPTISDPTALVIEDCNYLHIIGLRVTGLKQIPSGAGVSRGIDLRNVKNSKLERMELDHIGGYGYILSDGSNDNLFLNCDAHHMDDRLTTDGGAWGNANGFQCTGGSNATRNTFEGCRAWWISDDGFDFYHVTGIFTMINCWSFWNGYQPSRTDNSGVFTRRGDGDGFKLSGGSASAHTTVLRSCYRCMAFENASSGFDQNTGDFRFTMYNNTTFGNANYGYMWDYISPAPSQDFKNNLSYQDGFVRRGTETNGTTNSWNLAAPNSGDFVSTSSVGADGARQADGSLPDIDFMKLTPGSKYVDAGTIVSGILYSGSKPDIGAREYVADTIPSDLTVSLIDTLRVTLPTDSVYIASSVTGGTAPYTYNWSFQSGSGTIKSPSSANTWVKLTQGTYKIRLNVTDADNVTVYDDVVVIVNPVVGTIITDYYLKSVSYSGGMLNMAWWADVTSNTKSFIIQQKKSRVYQDIKTVTAVRGKKDYKVSIRTASGVYRLKVTYKTTAQYSIDYPVGLKTTL